MFNCASTLNIWSIEKVTINGLVDITVGCVAHDDLEFIMVICA